MRGCHRKREPEVLSEWLAQKSADWQPSYPFPRNIREPVIESLLDAQRGLCVYCGRKLDRSSPGATFHIEHFRPQSTHSHLGTCLANLFLSCGQETPEGEPSDTCGTAKGNWFDEAGHVEPEYPTCTHRFRFSLTGNILPNVNSDKAADQMIRILNLNHPELKREREEILFLIDGAAGEQLGYEDFIDPESRRAESYAHMVCQRFGTQIP